MLNKIICGEAITILVQPFLMFISRFIHTFLIIICVRNSHKSIDYDYGIQTVHNVSACTHKIKQIALNCVKKTTKQKKNFCSSFLFTKFLSGR